MEEKGAVCGSLHPGICFDPVSSRGQLTTCPHLFHYRCILQWSKIANLCPTCRVPFLEIRMYRKGHFVKSIAVEHRQNTSSEDDDSSYESDESEDWQNRCQICGDDSANGLILCDGEDGECTNAYHLRCIGLTAMPRGQWLCAECQSLEEFRRQHPEEFALCQTSESESDPSFSDPGSESSVSSEGDYEPEESEEVESTEAHSKPQSFVVSDGESDPSSRYEPPDSSESDFSVDETPKPEPKRTRATARIAPTISTRRNVHSMNETQRKRYIQRNLDSEYTPEDPIDQAWLIYRNIRNPRKRVRSRAEEDEEKKENCSPKTSASSRQSHSPEQFKKFVTDIVQKELGKRKDTDDLATKVHRRQTVANLVKQILQADKGRLRSDDRSVMKMKSRVRSALVTQLPEANQ